MFTTAFLRATLERAIKTFAQSLAALLVADGTDLLTTNWGDRLSVAGMAAVVSVLTSIASSATGDGPSLGNAETLNPAAPEPAVAIPEAALGDGLGTAVGGIVYGADSKAQAALHDGEYVITAKDVDNLGRGE